ncbi:cellulose synthase complex periplasmic endoglucanase BcsZ [Pseudomonas sp. zfem002]|uniref:cellulose synthase complex periplasmic endoglucanase BcsZ n=1 Tax=Pseudomonas sp. zfem002 TaxID=3078197 RepID=UPI0029298D90|nr:cellulose synthase complex periplasmic endoglucanase BcsZ [Pseudomonas sp. zfem002]MDU9394837.1 cellulose synthase complex periplasmic endoglucanase BcsZ [Pseudomonas sp. zfem002]
MASVKPTLLACALAACLLPAASSQAAEACGVADWPLWQSFTQHFIQPDGRVLDASTPQLHSSSEGQSYGMFFALVANDRNNFDRLWAWAKNNLAGSDIGNNLPGWWWGKDEQGQWRLLDRNSASDADLWFAYALFEAARLWKDDSYAKEATLLLNNIKAREVADLPGLGKMLLPGAQGFAKPDHFWHLNPSYLPVPVLRRMAVADPQGPWNEIARSTATLMKNGSYNGYVADWVGYRGTGPGTGLFVVDPVKGELGSYDAIRTYLWAGITPTSDPLAKPILDSLGGMAQSVATQGTPPEKVQVKSNTSTGDGPFGFSAALLPYFKARQQPWLEQQQRARVDTLLAQSLTPAAVQTRQPPYYDVVLSLFALGYMDEHYRFLADGKLQPLWETSCARAAKP